MKAKLIFNLPEEKESFENAVNADNYAYVIFELKHNIKRKLIKHTEKSADYVQGVEDAINEALSILETS